MRPPPNVERFVDAVHARLKELGRGQELRPFGGPSDTTMSSILKGDVRGRHKSTWTKLDDGLQWVRGSCERLLEEGVDPVPLPTKTDPPPHPLSAGETADLEAAVQMLMTVHGGLMQRGQWDLANALIGAIKTATEVGLALSRLNDRRSTST